MNTIAAPASEDGYRLWLRYEPLKEGRLAAAYADLAAAVIFPGGSASLEAARDELERGLAGFLGRAPAFLRDGSEDAGRLFIGRAGSEIFPAAFGPGGPTCPDAPEGFRIAFATDGGVLKAAIASHGDIGILYGVFAFLRRIAAGVEPREGLFADEPRLSLRMLDHWDNLDRSVERGYAGRSLWDWFTLPDFVDPRYRDYARANASIGINAAALTNVNANSVVLTESYLQKAKVLADVFRPYGIRVFLTARFSAPIDLGGLPTADPREEAVASWWRAKADEIYRHIPDFGGFLVKANSEGQPGPQDYGRSHAEGANLLARALEPHGGRVIWRAFVYSNEVPVDRAMQAYDEFKPLDGAFLPNVAVQVKNGPIDFQPREPFHPLFGAMKKTPVVLEFQITQEYLGFSTHLCYLAPLFKEVLDTDTYASGPGSTVARTVGGLPGGGIAAVANIGDERNWCGHHFAQANWYAYGRLAWDSSLSSESIADEWIKLTFGPDPGLVEPLKKMMMESREAVVDYMTPLGLHHIMGWDHHHGPGPWIDQGRADWTPVYFHRAGADGIGFDRGDGGSKALDQYFPEVKKFYGSLATCPENLVLYFHRLSWGHKMKSGKTLWDELCLRYQRGVETARRMAAAWKGMEGLVDAGRFFHVASMLLIQVREAVWWRDACLSYFGSLSKKPLPAGVEAPAQDLGHYKAIKEYGVPGIKPKW